MWIHVRGVSSLHFFFLYHCHATSWREGSRQNQKSWLLLLCVVLNNPLHCFTKSCRVLFLWCLPSPCNTWWTTYKASYCEEIGVRTVSVPLKSKTIPQHRHITTPYTRKTWLNTMLLLVLTCLESFVAISGIKQTNQQTTASVQLGYISNQCGWVRGHQNKQCPHPAKIQPAESSLADKTSSVPEADVHPGDHIPQFFLLFLPCHIRHSVSWSHLCHQPFCCG